MSMTRKDYCAIAEVLKRMADIAESHPVAGTRAAQMAMARSTAIELADTFRKSNDLFNTQRFLSASGVTD